MNCESSSAGHTFHNTQVLYSWTLLSHAVSVAYCSYAYFSISLKYTRHLLWSWAFFVFTSNNRIIDSKLEIFSKCWRLFSSKISSISKYFCSNPQIKACNNKLPSKVHHYLPLKSMTNITCFHKCRLQASMQNNYNSIQHN